MTQINTEVLKIIDDKIKLAMPDCKGHIASVSAVSGKLDTLIALHELSELRNSKRDEIITTNTKDITIINTRAKTKAGMLLIVLGLGGAIMWGIDHLILLFSKGGN